MADLYDELGIDPAATEAEIKAAKRKRSRETHPDHGGDPEAFDRVTKAALVLLDPERREHYDRTGQTEQRQTPILENAAGLIRQIMDLALDSFDPEREDLIARSIEGLEASKDDRADALAQLKRDLAKAERNRKRLTYRGTKGDVLGSMMDERIAGLRGNIKECSAAIEAHQLAIELLTDYEWQHEPEVDAGPVWMKSGTSAWA